MNPSTKDEIKGSVHEVKADFRLPKSFLGYQTLRLGEAMRVADRCLALLMKITCRVETGDYNRNLQRQARTTPAGFFRLSKSAHLSAMAGVEND